MPGVLLRALPLEHPPRGSGAGAQLGAACTALRAVGHRLGALRDLLPPHTKPCDPGARCPGSKSAGPGGPWGSPSARAAPAALAERARLLKQPQQPRAPVQTATVRSWVWGCPLQPRCCVAPWQRYCKRSIPCLVLLLTEHLVSWEKDTALQCIYTA